MQVRDAGNLLTRANLAIPSVDTDEIIVNYRSMDELVRHLRWASPLTQCSALAAIPLPAGFRSHSSFLGDLGISWKVQEPFELGLTAAA